MDDFDEVAESAVDDLVRDLKAEVGVSDVQVRRDGDFYVITFIKEGHGVELRLPTTREKDDGSAD
jgi:hypothetical protein